MGVKRPRERLSFVPEWDTAYQKWTAKFIMQNCWRCDPATDTFQDLMQEAWIVFDKVATTYPRVVDPQHFFALYKRALTNKFHDKASTRRRRFEGTHNSVSSEAAEIILNNMTDNSHAGYLAALIAEAPEEVKLALNQLSKPSLPRKSVRMSVRENLSSKLRRTFGVADGKDPVTELKNLLTA